MLCTAQQIKTSISSKHKGRQTENVLMPYVNSCSHMALPWMKQLVKIQGVYFCTIQSRSCTIQLSVTCSDHWRRLYCIEHFCAM